MEFDAIHFRPLSNSDRVKFNFTYDERRRSIYGIWLLGVAPELSPARLAATIRRLLGTLGAMSMILFYKLLNDLK